MEPVITTVLEALAAGAKAAASDSVKSIYNHLKQLIKQRWVEKPEEPDAETVLAGYASNCKLWESMLAQKLEESGINQDKNIYQQAEQLIQAVNSSTNLDNSPVFFKNKPIHHWRSHSPGHNVGRDFNQKTIQKQTRLAALLWLLALALTGVIGFGIYLFMQGRPQLPGTTKSQDAVPSELPSLESPPSSTATPDSSRLDECREIGSLLVQLRADLNNVDQSLDTAARGEMTANITDRYIGSIQAIDIKDPKVKDYQERYINLYRSVSQTTKLLVKYWNGMSMWDADKVNQASEDTQALARQGESLNAEFIQFCQSN